MRTTLDIEPDVMGAVRSLAKQRGKTMGQVLSGLARKALAPGEPVQMRNGVPVFETVPGQSPATMELVNALRDEDETP